VSGFGFALPAGALLTGACALISDAGVASLDPMWFARAQRVERDGIGFVSVRPADVPAYVEMGACAAGIVGKDVLWETTRECYELADLRFGRCRLVLAAPAGSQLASGAWPASLRVATKYPRSARDFFAGRGISVELIRLNGSVELAPSTGLADAVVDIVATGATLRANNLVEIAQAGESTARLVANHAALKTRGEELASLIAALRGVVDRSHEGAA
jgi:ATP phosphoribosyltransferase